MFKDSLDNLIRELEKKEGLEVEVSALKKISEDLEDPTENMDIMGPAKDDLYTNKAPAYGGDPELENMGLVVGDRVKLTRAVAEIPELPVGTMGSVVNVDPPEEGMIGVEWEQRAGYWNMLPDEIEKIKVVKTNTEASLNKSADDDIQIGDYVEVVLSDARYEGEVINIKNDVVTIKHMGSGAFEGFYQKEQFYKEQCHKIGHPKRASIDWHVSHDEDSGKYRITMNDSLMKEKFESSKDAWDWIDAFMKKNASLKKKADQTEFEESDMTMDEIKADVVNAIDFMIHNVNVWAVRDTVLKISEWEEFGPRMSSLDINAAKELLSRVEEELKDDHPDWWWNDMYDIVYHYANKPSSLNASLEKKARYVQLMVVYQGENGLLQAPGLKEVIVPLDRLNHFISDEWSKNEMIGPDHKEQSLSGSSEGLYAFLVDNKINIDELVNTDYNFEITSQEDLEVYFNEMDSDSDIESSLKKQQSSEVEEHVQQLADQVYSKMMEGEDQHSSEVYEAILITVADNYNPNLEVSDYINLVNSELDLKAAINVDPEDMEKTKITQIFKTNPKKLKLFSDLVEGSVQLKEISQEDLLEWNEALAKTALKDSAEEAWGELADIALKLFNKTRTEEK